MSSKKGALLISLACETAGVGVGDPLLTLQELTSKVRDYAVPYRLTIPKLNVGTLDSLMKTSEDLSKVDVMVRTTCSSVKRQYEEAAQSSGYAVDLRVHSKYSVEEYINNFQWDATKFPIASSKPHQVLKMLRFAAAKTESELKQLTSRFQDLRQQVQASNRAKAGSLLVKDLNDVLDSKASDIPSTYIARKVVVVPSFKSKAFEENYMEIANDVVTYPTGNGGSKGSPVVPDSLVKHTSDNEATVYTVMILRKFETEFEKKCKEMRCQVREFTYDETAHEERQQGVADTEAEYNLALRSLYQWCKVHFGEIVSTWVHIKVLRVFVESVLRYGLDEQGIPVQVLTAVLRPKSGYSCERVTKVVTKAYDHLIVGEDFFGGGSGSSTTKDASADTEYLPFVLQLIEQLN